ncbi:MAG: hypothetical protein IPN33_26080 [Saprospiraceae bacterium]|nr:hypothetical protein [Saprospiraceae bacterium]
MTIECDESTLPLNTGMATAPDVCGFSPVISFEDVILQGDCPLEYSISRTWTATDGAGNIIRCTQTITVEDNTPPVITCPSGVTLSCTASIQQ